MLKPGGENRTQYPLGPEADPAAQSYRDEDNCPATDGFSRRGIKRY
jgi:hypothetical protein